MNDDFDEPVATQNEHYAKFPSCEHAWLYIAIDIRDMSISKIGLTTKDSPINRIKEGRTYNPFLTLFTTYELSRCTFGVSLKELRDIERYIHRRSVFHPPIRHLYTGGESEWFYVPPDEAESMVDGLLAKRGFSVDGRYLYTMFEGPHNQGEMDIEQMKKIKKIYRPFPGDFVEAAECAGIKRKHYHGYIEYLRDFHSRPDVEKIYL
ncbi:GIY-YIG nuclease family protein [Oxalobacteraceae sp. CFBP 8763]|nr:GIY-YIG nuclease family protein [Oxalobacteraceae sp. CFBP 8763]